MNAENLSTYLNDHLAGSVGAIQLAGHMISTCKEDALEQWLLKLKGEIEEDQAILKKVIASLGLEESAARKAVAWVAEKASRAKLPFAGGGELDSVQALEGLLLGVTGKRSLWRTLSRVPDVAARLAEFDLANLEARAAGHYESIRGEIDLVAPAAF